MSMIAQEKLPVSATRRPAHRQRAAVGINANNNAAAFLFLSPWILGMVCLTLGPILASFYLSLTSYDMFTAPQWIGLDNYVKMAFEDSRYYQSLKVTFTYVFLSVPLKLAFALGIAMLLNRGLRGLGFYRSVFYLPSLLGGSVAVAIMWRQVFSYDGIINQILLKFGIDGPSWITSTDYALYTLVALAVWQFGSPMVIFLAGLKQIPQDIYDAAEVDGAGSVRKFVSITLPLLTPIIFFNFVMQIIGAFQAFTPAYIISGGKGGPADATLFYTLYLYEQAFTNFQMGYASAMAWVLVGIIGLATAISFLSARYWVHYGDER
ncbi:carbohydrate ABC transporter permease [Chelatococcus asaccharovorans]|uniref:Carbohydrate ABC transporter membrane protein 1 (CUT1 family) n=1 Tax=Chelatococcus asaccharovorans TaxID=28210 RepID=A0A2V3TY48_9HYPH|nr:sugar ABC transporter permease [Chelatococcus asaccharovorans]PXW54124.1 carbohydrate ABC transporter membrane protein 1 (CUT1 family) [Chelatococcus asaccharovorans]